MKQYYIKQPTSFAYYPNSWRFALHNIFVRLLIKCTEKNKIQYLLKDKVSKSNKQRKTYFHENKYFFGRAPRNMEC